MKDFLLISRPRFWIYLLGPYLLGVIAGLNTHASFSPLIIVWFLYFTLPANLLLYGINDIFDYETDKLNPKKQGFERLLEKNKYHKLLIVICILQLIFIPFLIQLPVVSLIYLLLFIFLGISYSAPPLRFKTKPVLDSLSNCLYIFPGLFIYHLTSQTHPSLTVFLIGLCWCAAMHAYSAIPDITADRKAKMYTTATFLGKKGAALYCLVLYLISGILTLTYIHPLLTLCLAFPYLYMCVRAWYKNPEQVMKDYTWFPLINLCVGGIVFFILLNA